MSRHLASGCPAVANLRDVTEAARPVEIAVAPDDAATYTVDRVMANLAARQHGVVAREQLLSAGIPAHIIEYRVKRRRLLRLYRGVYRVGPVVGQLAPEMAAALACGEAAAVSHLSAEVLWRINDRERPVTVHVSTPRGCPQPGAGVRVHRVASLPRDEIMVIDAVPVTSPARTLLDLASCKGIVELERSLAHAYKNRIMSRRDMELILARYPRRAGAGKLRALLSGETGPSLTRSEAERRFLALIRRAQLPAPQCNVVVRGYEVDFLWRAERLVAEVDGFAYHSSRRAFERDRRRDAALAASGLRVIRVTWRQLSNEAEAVLARVAQALAWSSDR